MRRAVFALALALTAAPVLAQSTPDHLSGAGQASDVTPGTYLVEPNHTQVAFSVSHMGITPFAGTFSEARGSMTLDPADLSKTQLDVTIPIASVQTTSAKLDGELKSADWFDAAKYPEAKFHATDVQRTGDDTARITGNLTLHGVTQPITIGAKFFGTAPNPLNKKVGIGFLGRAVIKRSDFGIDKYVPLVSDETVLIFNAAFDAE
ncbi:YceI family protein [Stakelama marina]|nr:YceI family protein [Stakelama marina]